MILKEVAAAIKGKNMTNMRDSLERLFDPKYISSSFTPALHFMIKSPAFRTIVIINASYASEPELIQDGIAIGYI